MDSREAHRSMTYDPLACSVVVGPNTSYSNSCSIGGVSKNSTVLQPSPEGMVRGMRLSSNHMPPAEEVPNSIESSASDPLYHRDDSMRPGGVLSMDGELIKKKRGRPRKYGPDASMALAVSPLSSASRYSNSGSSPMTGPLVKRRGRPPGSRKLEALGSAGTAFTPHLITVKAGEDVASKIMAFLQQGLRSICILSAYGDISNATLLQPGMSGGTIFYEDRFIILSLSGTFLPMENDGRRVITGSLNVTLAGSDGRVIGGGVAGMLKAASPVEVIVGSFIAGGKKPKPEPVKPEPSSAPPLPLVASFGVVSAASPSSPGPSSESSDDDPESPMNHSGSISSNSGQLVPSMPPHASTGWPHAMK